MDSHEDRIDDGARKKLEPEWVPATKVAGWITAAILLALLVAVNLAVRFWFGLPNWALISIVAGSNLLIVGSSWLLQIWPPIAYRNMSYSVDRVGVEIRKGVVWRRILSIPRSRIQHIDVSRGPLERKFGLATLTLHTAGTMNSSVELPGLGPETAYRIRDFLIAESGDDAV